MYRGQNPCFAYLFEIIFTTVATEILSIAFSIDATDVDTFFVSNKYLIKCGPQHWKFIPCCSQISKTKMKVCALENIQLVATAQPDLVWANILWKETIKYDYPSMDIFISFIQSPSGPIRPQTAPPPPAHTSSPPPAPTPTTTTKNLFELAYDKQDVIHLKATSSIPKNQEQRNSRKSSARAHRSMT